MNYEISKKRFVDAWGALGNSWGVPRTMSQIHAMLLVAPEPLTADEIMTELGISRGNVSMGLRSLEDWGIVFKEYKPGDRKKYYRSEKDIWKISTQIAKERKRRELDPLLDVLKEVENIKDKGAKKNELEEMNKMTAELKQFASQADSILERFIKAERKWFFKTMMKWFS